MLFDMNDFEFKFFARRICDTLTRQNNEKWFKLMKQWLIDEKFWSVVDWEFISKFDQTISIINEINVTSNNNEYIWKVDLDFDHHVAKKKLDAKAQYQLIACIDDDDQKLMTKLKTVKKIWKTLINKYKKKFQTIERQYLQKLMIYKKFSNIIIETIYIDIIKKSRKIASMQSNITNLIKSKRRFQSFLQFLTFEYDVIRDAIDAQNNSNVDKFIQKLQEKKTQLIANKTVESTLLIENNQKNNRRQSYRISQRRFFNSNQSSRRFNVKTRKTRNCFLCDNSHRIANCDFLKKLRKWTKKQKIKKIMSKNKKHKAYNVEDFSSFSNFDIDIDSNNEKHMKKIVVLFKKLINKFLKFVWIANIDVSSHRIDDFRLFNEFLKSIKRRTIKIEKRRLYSNQCDSMTMRVKNNESMLTKVFYVFDFDVNLLFDKHFIKKKLIKNFNDDNLFMRIKQSVEVLRAFAQENIYIVNKITSKLKKYALLTNTMFTIESFKVLFVSFAMSTIVNSNETLSDVDTDFRSDVEINSQQFEISINQSFKKKRDLYQLWHRRFDHMKFAKFRNLHKVITLRKSIFIVEKRNESCEICAITKMINSHNRCLIERKINILKLIFIDICESLFVSRFDYEYFLKIVNNHFRRTWIISLRKRTDASKALNKWKLKMKLKIERRLQTIRCDNVKKLKSILYFWCAFIDIVSQYIVFYNFIQNDVIKRDIKTIENQIRTMIQNAKLFIKFWFETKKTNAYVRNRVNTNSIVDDNSTNFIEVWTNVKSFINHLRVWECKCYSFVDTKSLFENNKKNKFINTEKSNVFMNYDENIITQYKIWAFDRRDIIKHHKIMFFENKKWESESLNLLTITMNALFERRSVEKSRKTVISMTSAFAIIFVAFTFVTSSTFVEFAIFENKNEAQAKVKSMNAKKNDEFNDISDEKDEINEFIAKSTVQTRVKLTSFTKFSVRNFDNIANNAMTIIHIFQHQ